MKKIFLSIFLAGLGITVSAQKSIDQKVTELMAKMTLEEKIGQLNQYNDDITAPVLLRKMQTKLVKFVQGN